MINKMSIKDAKKRMIGRQLVDWIFLGVETGARKSVEEYRKNKTSNPAMAKDFLTRAVNMPRRARLRIEAWISEYDTQHKSGAAETYLNECLHCCGSITLSEIMTELKALEAKTQSIIDNNASGATLDETAISIEQNLNWTAKEWEFLFPSDYKDLELLDN
jgi:HD-like signal output (HDOD) protein